MFPSKSWGVTIVCAIAFSISFIFSYCLYTGFQFGNFQYQPLDLVFKYISQKEQYLSSNQCRHPFSIFVYPLPTVFNAQIIPYLERYLDNTTRCPANTSSRLPRLLDGQCPIMQFNTEIIIHWLLANHPCVTSAPDKATFFYFPVYAYYMHLIDRGWQMNAVFREPLQLLNEMLRNSSRVDAFYEYADRQAILDWRKISQNKSQLDPNIFSTDHYHPYPLPARNNHILPSFYKSYLYRNQLCDHIFVGSRPFYSSDGSYIWQAGHGRGLQHNIIWLAIEVLPRYPLYKYKSKLTKNIAIPYVVSGEIQQAGNLIYEELKNNVATIGMGNETIEPCRVFCSGIFPESFLQNRLERNFNGSLKRPMLAFFAGSTKSIRKHIRDLLSTMEGSLFKLIPPRSKRLDNQLTFMYLKSIFCFVAPGDTPSSKRLYDIIASNCLPVIISDAWELPFAHLPWDTFSLRFMKDDLINNSSMIRSALTSMPPKQILSMQINLYNNRHHFLYPLTTEKYVSQPNDAMDTVLHELSLKQQYAKTCQNYG